MPFPTVRWKRERATFVPEEPLLACPVALVFPFYGDRVVLAEISGRGWCIPSGHVECGETPEQTVRREAYEEAGVTLGQVVLLGHFVLTPHDSGEPFHAPTFIASVQGLEELPAGSEAVGRQLVALEDVAECYFAWDALLSAVFAYAWERKEQVLFAGVPIPSCFPKIEP